MTWRSAASWILAVGLAAALGVLMGLQKFIGPDPNPIFGLIAGRSGVAAAEPLFRYAVGAAEILAAILLVFPRTRLQGALLGGGVALGAVVFHLSPFLGVRVPDVERVATLLRQGRTTAEIDAMALPTDGGALFAMALAFLAAAAALVWLERMGDAGGRR
ncbi:MAG: hypothetical protein ACOY4K_11945 [Pseudomonadota bacterium]